MASGRFGALDLMANNDVVLMEGLAGNDRVANIRFVNRNGISVTVSMALVPFPAATAIANLDPADYLEFDAQIGPNNILENTGIVVPTGFSIIVKSNTNNVNVIAYGFTEEI